MVLECHPRSILNQKTKILYDTEYCNHISSGKDEKKKKDYEEFLRTVETMKRKREEEDRIIAEKKKKFVDPFTAEEGFIAAVEDDLDYEFE